jgi:hypothetical protein
MRYCFLILCVLFLSGDIPTASQQDTREPKQRYVLPPDENILLVVASQSDCPIQFENARLILSAVDGEWGVTGQVRNRGTKSIRHFTSVIWVSLGTGGTLGGSDWSSGKVTRELFMPGQIVNLNSEGEIVPLSEKLREKLKLRGPMQAVAVLMVERVVFDDGTIYSEESTSKALRKYFEKVAEGVARN